MTVLSGQKKGWKFANVFTGGILLGVALGAGAMAVNLIFLYVVVLSVMIFWSASI